jgi:hypothetical protein
MARWKLAGLFCFTLLAGCRPSGACTAEVTDGRGTFKATAEGRAPQADLERAAVRAACEKLCAAMGDADDACVSRCDVDAASGKIGARTTCNVGSP